MTCRNVKWKHPNIQCCCFFFGHQTLTILQTIKSYLTTKTVPSLQNFCVFKMIRNCKKSTFFWDFSLLSDCPFIIITVLLHKGTERWKYCQLHPKNSLEVQCLSDERACLMIRLRISLAAACLRVYMCAPLSVILSDCRRGFLPVLHSFCWSSCVQIHPWVFPKNKIACQRKSSWQGDGSEILLPSLVCSSVLLTFHINGISIYSVGAAFLLGILFGHMSESRDKGAGDTGDKSTFTAAALKQDSRLLLFD